MLAAPTRTSVVGGSQRGDRGGGPEKQVEDEVMETQSLSSLGVSERLCCSVFGMEGWKLVPTSEMKLFTFTKIFDVSR